MEDKDVVNLAVQEERVLLTLDRDLGELVHQSNSAHRGILLLRVQDQRPEMKIKILAHILDNFEHEFRDHFCVYHRGKFRIC